MLTYERILSYGNIIQLKLKCDVKKLVQEISKFKFKQYNPDKDINRYGLSVTSLNGEINGIDLDTLRNKPYDELSFRQKTEVYYSSKELQKLVDPFDKWLCRTHFLNIKKGGYFPPHRDEVSSNQKAFRIIVPLVDFNPPQHFFIVQNQIVSLNEGYAYFVNTNLEHGVFSYSNDTLMLIMNIEACNDSYETVLRNMHNL